MARSENGGQIISLYMTYNIERLRKDEEHQAHSFLPLASLSNAISDERRASPRSSSA